MEVHGGIPSGSVTTGRSGCPAKFLPPNLIVELIQFAFLVLGPLLLGNQVPDAILLGHTLGVHQDMGSRRSAFFEKFKDLELPPGPLAVPCDWTFIPEECETEYLQGLVEGRYDGMNAGDDRQEAKDIEAARAELRRRGIPV